MKKQEKKIRVIDSVSELHRIMALPKPAHPLITLIQHTDENPLVETDEVRVILNFYNITIKRSFRGQLKYGKNFYDFDEGTMSFVSPNQVIAIDREEDRNKDGWSLLFHPDLIRNYPLGKSIKNFGFFSYDVNEALHLSGEEETLIEDLVKNIGKEYAARIDSFSSDVIVANLELLLTYCNRFYNRQFVTRKTANTDLLTRFENILSAHFEETGEFVMPTVQSLAAKMHLSPNYLSDMLRTLTGMNTQQYIHVKLIDEAKNLLTTTSLSVGEIAFRLGFEFPQSFNKLFKSKTNLSPLQFRSSFN
jgi:AraC family transcriptional activator of pobA